ncbi:MAG: hypothetical protein MUF57_09810 [Gammaproteobacteria bacterium]|nr:hypothetical protein [Gammaproteobacteria bacterium]
MRGRSSRIDRLSRIVVFVVNSLSVPKTDWDRNERPPNDAILLLKATGVPIDRYSYESVELLKDLVARWKTLRALRDDVPDIELYVVDVSFEANPSPAERDYLNALPTSFALTDDEVDRLRAAAAAAMRESPEFRRLLEDLAATPAPAR